MKTSFFCAIIAIFVLSSQASARAPVSPRGPKREIAKVEKTKVNEKDDSIKDVCPYDEKASSQSKSQ